MTPDPILSKQQLQSMLVNTRQMVSLIDREIAMATSDIKRETVNWVPMWVDWGHTVRSDCDTATAVRAISDRGEFLWYVRHDTKKHGYHSQCDGPFEAIDEAMQAWHKRKAVRSMWPQVSALSRDLVLGRQNFRITMEDAEQSALCTLGVKWFRDRMHLSKKQSLSGRSAAMLMKIEPQVGFVIYEAALREGAWAHTAMPRPAGVQVLQD